MAPSCTNSGCWVTSSACQPSRGAHTPSCVPNSSSAILGFHLPGDQQRTWAGWRSHQEPWPEGLRGEQSPFVPLGKFQLAQTTFWSHSMNHEQSIMCNVYMASWKPALFLQANGDVSSNSTVNTSVKTCAFIFRRHTSFVGILEDSVYAYSIHCCCFHSLGPSKQ